MTNNKFRHMKIERNQVKFYFDKNIWSDIANMTNSERRSFDLLITPLKEQSKIGIWYSPINVLELIRGMLLEAHYEMCRKEIKITSEITDKHFLEYPWDHVRRSADYFLKRPFREPALVFLQLCRDIVISPYKQIEPRIAGIRKLLLRWEKEWSEQLNSVKQFFNRLPQQKAEKFKEDEWFKRRREKAWEPFCRQFSLPQELKNLPFDEVNAWFHSFRYWRDYRISYENKLHFENRKPEPSDYLDWMQTVYLNIMDYLVTNDRSLIAITKESDNKELNPVTLTFTEFLNCLDRGLPKRRAPETILVKWYDAK